MDPEFYSWVVLPAFIFLARVMDVTLGTLRIIFVSRGRRRLAPLLGFFEVLIWIVVISQVVRNLDNIVSYIAYAAGFAAGNFVGMYIEDKLAIGTLIIRLIVPDHSDQLVERLRSSGFGVTSVMGQGANGPVTLIYTIIKRQCLPEVEAIIHHTHPRAFLTIEELKSVDKGVFPPKYGPLFFGKKK